MIFTIIYLEGGEKMCCCDKPTINGELGYKWQPNDKPSIRRPDPPEIGDGDSLLFDEPGRCGGIDSHCHHYRIVKNCGTVYLLVRNGGGDKRICLSLYDEQLEVFTQLDSNGRYWILNALYHAQSDSAQRAREMTTALWRQAAAEKRIKTRKVRGGSSVKVWIEEGLSNGNHR